MVSFWGCRWQEMLESISILTFAFPSSAPLTFCHCLVSDGCGQRYLHPFLCRVSLGTRSQHTVLCGDSEVPCVPPASPVSMQQGPEFFLPFCKILPPRVKGDTVLWWLAASGSSSVHSSFSVVGNNDSRAIQKHGPWGEGPSSPAELCALSPHPRGTGRWRSGVPSVPLGWVELGSGQQAACCGTGKSKVTELQQGAVSGASFRKCVCWEERSMAGHAGKAFIPIAGPCFFTLFLVQLSTWSSR